MKYISVDLSVIAPPWRGDFYAEIISAIHCHVAGQVMVAFPKMVVGETANLGPEMRLFGNAGLTRLMAQSDFTLIKCSIEQLGGVLSAPQPVPPTSEYRVYQRDRKADRDTPSRQRRRMRRTGEAGRQRICNPDRLPYLRLIGFSSGERVLPIFIREILVPKASTGVVSSYGLSSAEDQVAVPHF